MTVLLQPGGTILVSSLRLLLYLLPSLLSRRHLNAVQFLGAFVKFRKATICFVVFFHMSFHKKHIGSHWKVFMKFDFARLSKICQKIQVS